ncbi:pantoate--beta-alanine ligase [Rhizohabitans arisaemae]|uniref:pantoate--beta-alanine ligase n=1 Tax=Rhizohabitans arisaemae TaxID=2720610 RepID=UPI0024B0FC27|nr:pantoate--beta-alanine ligase [Rhizohabitans arisaemae]
MGVIVADGRAELAEARAKFSGGTLALVPTMGALHEGHRSLISLARGHADHVAVSIFVNPLQFSPNEDFSRYPRTLERDLAVCEEAGAALVFTPSAAEMYPEGRQVSVSSGTMGTLLEGAFRPGHFDGVLTVVLKLFNLVQPNVAVFGRKDAQQLAVIKRMVADLDVPVTIVGAPTVRDPDGLAMSSRNRYLSAEDRVTALALSRALTAGHGHAELGPQAVLAQAGAVLDQAAKAEPPLEVDYLALVDPATFAPVPPGFAGEAILAVAARVGSTRLIDNSAVVLPGGPPA